MDDNGTGNGYADRSALANGCQRRYTAVDTAQGRFRVQSLSAQEWMDYQATLMMPGTTEPNKSGFLNAPRHLVSVALVDGAGNQLLDPKSPDDRKMLAGLDSQLLDVLTSVIRDHCGIAKEGGPEAPEKNLAPNGGTPTD